MVKGVRRPGLPQRLLAAVLAMLPAQVPAAPVSDPGLVAALRPIRDQYALPALAGAIVTGEGLAAQGVVGVRKAGTDVPATLDDRWHLGSCTKAMTATLAARLVEQGRLAWEVKLAVLFPDLAPRLHPARADVTLEQLLSHHAGLPPNLAWGGFARYGDLCAQRRQVVGQALTGAPPHAVGGPPVYANLGYVVAGAALERAAGRTWEDLVREWVFQPLGMASAGFGGVGTPGEIDQPWPHHAGGRPAAGNGPSVDNPDVLGPAGRVHATLADWAKFVVDQLRGARGEPALLKPESYAKLHTAVPPGDYALGWVVAERGWGGGRVLTHAGCNTMNYAVAWLAPRRKFAVLVVCNQGDDEAAKATDEAAAALIRLHAATPPPG